MPEYITLRDAIEFCGPRVIAGWRGNGLERHAPSRSELIAERSKVLEMSAEAILADAKAGRARKSSGACYCRARALGYNTPSLETGSPCRCSASLRPVAGGQ